MSLTNKQFNTKLEQAKGAGVKARDLITELAMDAREHIIVHSGNTEKANALLIACRSIGGIKCAALQAWFMLTTPTMTYQNGELLKYSKPKAKAFDAVKAEIFALANPWHSIESEKKPAKIVLEFDVLSETQAFLNRLIKKHDNAVQAGGKVGHETLLSSLQALVTQESKPVVAEDNSVQTVVAV